MFIIRDVETEHLFVIGGSREGRAIMKKSLIFLSLGAVLGCGFFSIFLMNVLAKEPPKQEMISYYTCIEIRPGDTLWSIAEIYTEGTDISVDDYVRRLKQMNHIGEDTIHPGHYLTVMYQRPLEQAEEKSSSSVYDH